jgi:GT2 family glycosyltransferase
MIFILLPVHNRRAVTENFARALARQTCQDFHLVLIDDGSADGTAAAVAAILPRQTTVLRGAGDWWWGGALDQGWRWLAERAPSNDDDVLICNDDVDLPDEFLARGAELLGTTANCFFVALARDAPDGAISETCFTIDYPRCAITIVKPGGRVDCAPTRGLFIRWTDMRKVGGFRPRLLPHYLADLEWTLRAHRRGLAICRDERLWLTPHHDMTGVRDVSSMSPLARMRQLFSIKFVSNPRYWSTFVVLCFPVRYWIPALFRVCVWTIGIVIGR